MKIDIPETTQSIQRYLDREISGGEFSKILHQIVQSAEDLDKKQRVLFKYYIDFFEKEGDNLYLKSNKYLKEEVAELNTFINSLNA